MSETWLVIPEYEFYEVSSFGQVRSLPRQLVRKDRKPLTLPGRTLKPYPSGGYLTVDLLDAGRRSRGKVHRLVAGLFVDNPANKPYVNHLDGDKTNNDCRNLRWVTSSENALHAWETGLTNGARKYLVYCVELDLIAFGTPAMVRLLQGHGVEVSAAGVRRACLSQQKKYRGLTFRLLGERDEKVGSEGYHNIVCTEVSDIRQDRQ